MMEVEEGAVYLWESMIEFERGSTLVGEDANIAIGEWEGAT